MEQNSALLVIDVQNDFLPGGSLAVEDGNAIIPLINDISRKFQNVIITQDWHTNAHLSFASSHEGKAPFDTIEMPYGTQVLWPEHCVQESHGAALASDLNIPHTQMIIRKGYNHEIDSYSAFMEADKTTMTGLTGYLRERGIDSLYLCGLATDFCVAWSALDARAQGFECHVIEDACRAIDLDGSLKAAWENMQKAGVKPIQSNDL
jgi:nicotinamidase/pyrazinamidase